MADPQKRAGRLTALMGLSGRTALLLAVLVLAIAAVYRLDWRADWSYYGQFTLHPELARIISEQQAPVSMTVIGARTDDGPGWRDHVEAVAESVEDLAGNSDLLAYRFIDPEIDKPELQAFAGEEGQIRPRSIYLDRGERRHRIAIGGETPMTLQRDIGGALLSLDREQRLPVSFLRGHGELNPAGTGPDGCSALRRALELAGFAPRVLGAQDIDRLGRLPEAGTVIIPGPTKPLGTELIGHLANHLKDGGTLLVLADDRCPVDLAVALRLRGVILGPGMPAAFAEEPMSIFDREAEVAEPLTVHSATEALVGQNQRFDRLLLGPPHITPTPITNRVLDQQQDILSPRSTPLITAASPYLSKPLGRDRDRLFEQVGTPPFTILTHLLSIDSGSAWLTLAGDWAKPRTRPQAGVEYRLAVAMEYQAHTKSVRPDLQARMVVWGSREAGSDAVLRQGIYANETLLVDAVSWLTRREEPTVIPPADYAPIRVDATDGQMQVLFVMLVIVLPMLCLGGAMIAWWERR